MTAPPPVRRYACETRIMAGIGSLSTLSSEIQTLRIKTPILVCDAGIANAGLLEKWLPSSLSTLPRVCSKVNPDPDDVTQATLQAKKINADGVVIIGGGSALCLGKALSIMLTNSGRVQDYEGFGKVAQKPAPTVAVPTTAGSGSEVSRALVLHEKGRDTEIVIVGYGTEPAVAILDATLLLDCPDKPLLYSALDALTHSLESLWVKNRSLVTDALAEKAARTIMDVLPTVMKTRDLKSLQILLEASSVANLACGNTGLGLVHGLSCAPSVPLAHGYQNGALLLAVAKFNRPNMDPDHQLLVDKLEKLFEDVSWFGKFQELEVDASKSQAMIKASRGHPFRLNNIRTSSDQDCGAILRASGAMVDSIA